MPRQNTGHFFSALVGKRLQLLSCTGSKYFYYTPRHGSWLTNHGEVVYLIKLNPSRP